MKKEPFILITSSIFLLITLLHLTRVIAGWQVTIHGWVLPLSLSYLAVLIAGLLALHGFKLAGKL